MEQTTAWGIAQRLGVVWPAAAAYALSPHCQEAKAALQADRYDQTVQTLCERLGVDRAQADLYFCLCMAEDTYRMYQERRIDERIFWDTMTDIPIWVGNYRLQTDRYGLAQMGWLKNHLTGRLYRLGRLQFEMSRNTEAGMPFETGASILHVHIPQGEPLHHDACLHAYEQARVFFPAVLGHRAAAFVCGSWLLHPNLRHVLGQGSNILRFQSDYTLYKTDADNSQTLERVFGFTYRPGQPYPQDTSLQRAVARYLDQGGELGNGYGYILI